MSSETKEVGKERVRLTRNGLKADLENGLTRPEMADKYGISVGQINKALKEAGLKSMRATYKKYTLEPDSEVKESPEVAPSSDSTII